MFPTCKCSYVHDKNRIDSNIIHYMYMKYINLFARLLNGEGYVPTYHILNRFIVI